MPEPFNHTGRLLVVSLLQRKRPEYGIDYLSRHPALWLVYYCHARISQPPRDPLSRHFRLGREAKIHDHWLPDVRRGGDGACRDNI